MNVEFTKGNHKLPKSTYIINLGCATDCPSKRLGLCQCPTTCYALKAEVQYYKTSLPFRRRQRKVFDSVSYNDIVSALLNSSKNSKKHIMTHLRFSEAGDFENQKDVTKLLRICKKLNEAGIVCYGYTARTDLNLSGLIKYAHVNVSNDYGNWINKGANRFKLVQEYTDDFPRCKGNCRICSLCYDNNRGKTIEVKQH